MVETSCVSGLCGSCKTKFLSGTVDHRDFILADDERETHLTVCVSRATSSRLVLDL
jgi:vanillate O-demethylase ferredoxin subunit